MMAEECWPVERLAEAATLPAGDPRLDHLARCPRCRARLAAYRCFMTGKPAAGTDPDAAESALRDFLAGDVLTPQVARRRRPSLLGLLSTPVLWPVVAAAAVLIVSVGLWRGAAMRRGAGEGAPVLRGEASLRAAPVPLAAGTLPDGRLQLRWRGQAGADAYKVVLYGADLAEVARVDASADSSAVIDSPAARYWCVIALRGGDEIGRSTVVPLRSGG